MAITAETRTDIIELVVGIFGAAPGANILSELADTVDAGLSLNDLTVALVENPVFKDMYPSFLTNDEFATSYLTAIFGGAPGVGEVDQANFDIAHDAVTALLNAGQSRGEVVYQIINAISNVSEDDPAFGGAAAKLNNQTEVAVHFSVTTLQSADTADELVAVVSGVGSTQASVDAALADINDSESEGGIFTLTSGIDNLIGGAGDDLFIGTTGSGGEVNDPITIQTSDRIDGGDGFDTFRIAMGDEETGEDAVPELISIERIQIQSTDDSWDGVNSWGSYTDLEVIESYRSSDDDINLDDQRIPQIVEVRWTDTDDDNDIWLEYADAAVSGSDDTQRLTLKNSGTFATMTAVEFDVEDVSNNTDIIENFWITSNGSGNALRLNDSDGASTITIAGSADLYLDVVGQLALTTVDASGLSADLTMGNLTVTGDDITYTGASGDDTVTFGAGDDTIDAGEGDNTIDTGGGNNTVITGAGDDTITIGAGNDTVDAGAGDDTVVAAGNLATGDSVDGGADTDTLSLTSAAASGAGATFDGLFENFEEISISDALAGNLDMSLLDDIQTLKLAAGVNGSHTISGLDSGASVSFLAAAALATDTTTVSVTGALAASTDVLNVTVSAAASADYGVLAAADVETLNITSTQTGTATVVNTLDVDAAVYDTVTVAGSTALDLSGVAITSIDTLDASGFDADLTVSLAGNANDVTITAGDGDNTITAGDGDDDITVGDGDNINIDGGLGDDTITAGEGDDTIVGGAGEDTIDAGDGDNSITGGAGGDTLTGGAGIDTYVFAAVGDSQGVNVDTITNFDADDDIIDLSAVAIGAGSYNGEANGYGAVLTSLTGDATNTEAVLDTSTNTLYVDVNADGQLDSNDMAIQLTGISDLTEADNFVF